jgi:hypothetical protein
MICFDSCTSPSVISRDRTTAAFMVSFLAVKPLTVKILFWSSGKH